LATRAIALHSRRQSIVNGPSPLPHSLYPNFTHKSTRLLFPPFPPNPYYSILFYSILFNAIQYNTIQYNIT
jgi:hypothetical protein